MNSERTGRNIKPLDIGKEAYTARKRAWWRISMLKLFQKTALLISMAYSSFSMKHFIPSIGHLTSNKEVELATTL